MMLPHLVVCAGDNVVINAPDLKIVGLRTEHTQQREEEDKD